jgi:hypothetical protein
MAIFSAGRSSRQYRLGLFIGAQMFGAADEGVFRRICYALIAVAVLVSLPLLDGVIR